MDTKEYEKQVKEFVVDLILKYDGLRKAARATGIDPALLSRVRTGSYLPKEETFKKWQAWAQNESKVDLSVGNATYSIYCKDLSEFKETLRILGFELEIKKVGT